MKFQVTVTDKNQMSKDYNKVLHTFEYEKSVSCAKEASNALVEEFGYEDSVVGIDGFYNFTVIHHDNNQVPYDYAIVKLDDGIVTRVSQAF